MSELDQLFQKPQRQAPAAVIFILITFLRKSFRRFWFLFIPILFQKGETRSTNFVGLLVLISVIQLISSLVQYFRFFFYVNGGELIIESRRLRTTRTNIPLDRIQTVNFEQGPLHRLFKVVKVQIDTAGSEQAELSLDALDLKRAEALRSFILAQKALIAEETPEASDPDASDIPPSPPKDELLLALEPGEIFRVGLAQNHIQTAGIILGFFLGLSQYAEEFFDFNAETIFLFLQGVEGSSALVALLAGTPILLIAAVVVSVVRIVIRYFGFKAWKTERGIKLVAGLFTRREQAATQSKIQLIRWYQTLFELRLGISRVRLFQASGTGIKRKQALTLPGCKDEQKEELYQILVAKEEQTPYTFHKISQQIIFRRILFRGILPGIAVSLILFPAMGLGSFAALLAIPFTIYTARRYYDRYQLGLNEHSVMIQAGVWGNRGILMPWYKVQAVRISSSPYQRRHDLNTVRLSTAGGTVSIPFLPNELARQIANYALYRIEASDRAWM